MAPIRKTNSYIQILFSIRKKISLFSAYKAKTGIDMVQPHLCWNRTVDRGGEQVRVGKGHGGQG